jgi:hypothetical protein
MNQQIEMRQRDQERETTDDTNDTNIRELPESIRADSRYL